MSTWQKRIDEFALPIAMIIGVVFWRVFIHVQFLLAPLLFLMLFFTFCKINPLDLRLRVWHWVVLAVLMPTATAAPIIAGKLGGSIQNLTTFTLLSNFVTSLIVPLFFPYVNPAADLSFWQAGWLILQKVSPVLLGPFIAAWGLRLVYNAVQKHRYHLSESVFRLAEDYDFRLTPYPASCSIS